MQTQIEIAYNLKYINEIQFNKYLKKQGSGKNDGFFYP
ncbi:MAG TPA: hypothetical protein VF677_16380 [Flavobacterium sp.]